MAFIVIYRLGKRGGDAVLANPPEESGKFIGIANDRSDCLFSALLA